MKVLSYKAILLIIFVGLLANQAVYAATATTNLTVQASILAACNTLTASTLDFGNYDPTSGIALNGQTAISLNCTLLTPFTIALGPGVNSGGSFTSRNMKNTDNTDLLAYNLYTSLLRTTVWGDGTAGTSTVSGAGLGPLIPVSVPVYGTITAGQNRSTGTYQDTVLVTVTY